MKGCEPDENEKCESSSYSPAAHSRNGYRVSVVENERTAYASAPASVLIEEEEGQSEAL